MRVRGLRRYAHSRRATKPTPVCDPARRRRTKVERRWHELRGGIFEHEPTAKSPGDSCPPGHLSRHALVGRMLGGEQLGASNCFMQGPVIKSRWTRHG